jgi:hypothetical protein
MAIDDQVYLGPFPRRSCQQLAGVIRNHIDEVKDQSLRTTVEMNLKPDHWVTRDQIAAGEFGAGTQPAGSSNR